MHHATYTHGAASRHSFPVMCALFLQYVLDRQEKSAVLRDYQEMQDMLLTAQVEGKDGDHISSNDLAQHSHTGELDSACRPYPEAGPGLNETGHPFHDTYAPRDVICGPAGVDSMGERYILPVDTSAAAASGYGVVSMLPVLQQPGSAGRQE